MHVVYSAWLALHYFRKNATKSGKLVNTSSMAGLYPVDALPLYTAANHGVRPRVSLFVPQITDVAGRGYHSCFGPKIGGAQGADHCELYLSWYVFLPSYAFGNHD